MENTEIFERAKRAFELNAFALHNHMYLINAELGYAECGMEIKEDSTNPYGMVHGGAYFTLADMTAGCAARADGRRHVTLSVSCSYLHSAQSGHLKSVAKVIHAGRKTTLTDVNVYDDEGTLCFTGQITYFCIAEKGEDLPYKTKQAEILNKGEF